MLPATLVPTTTTSVVHTLELFDARRVRMDKRDFALAGTEEFWHRKQATNFPQSW